MEKFREYCRNIGTVDQASKSVDQDTALVLILIQSLPVDYQRFINILDIQVSYIIKNKIMNISKPRNYDFRMLQNKHKLLEVQNTIVDIIDC
jgi:hypothetical protein